MTELYVWIEQPRVVLSSEAATELAALFPDTELIFGAEEQSLIDTLKAQLPSLKVVQLGAEISADAYDGLVAQYEEKKRLDLSVLDGSSSSTGGRSDAPGDWQLIFRQTAGTYKPIDHWRSVNPEDSSAPNFSLLDRMESFRGAGGVFKFKMQWHGSREERPQIWTQSSNPLTHRKEVKDYCAQVTTRSPTISQQHDKK